MLGDADGSCAAADEHAGFDAITAEESGLLMASGSSREPGGAPAGGTMEPA